ncbi:MAG: DNA polymerase III subunit delta [Pseudomonadota bacterium]
MKLSTRDLRTFAAKPDPSHAGLLLHGPDSERITLLRGDITMVLIGPDGADEMRLTRLTGAELRKDPARALDALKSTGFFPGPRAVTVEEAGDGNAKALAAALEDWQPGDAYLLVTAGQLAARSALRKLFEQAPNAASAGVYADPPGRGDIEDMLDRAGIAQRIDTGVQALLALAQEMDAGDLRQTVEKLALYKLGDDAPLGAEDVAACAPTATDAALDDLVAAVADGAVETLSAALPRLAAQGTAPTGICIALSRHFRLLHRAASDPAGPEQGLSRARPPVFGPRRDRMLRQARAWGAPRLETALRQIMDTDLALRSTGHGPGQALVERTMIRLAMLPNR